MSNSTQADGVPPVGASGEGTIHTPQSAAQLLGAAGGRARARGLDANRRREIARSGGRAKAARRAAVQVGVDPTTPVVEPPTTISG